MRNLFKSTLFNILFYSYMVVGSFLLIWIFAVPRKIAVRVVRWYFSGVGYLEKWVLGIELKVTGLENLPQDGRYILAMKHQSAYETIKLLPVFGDVAIALKRELTWIPLWGWYTLKTGMISIHRGARGRAMDSLLKGAKKALSQGRPLVIYPQGTRTPVGASCNDYPYKAGVARMAEALGVPIIPVALNSGVFWAKKAFIKRSGVVEFNILPPIQAKGKLSDTLSALQNALEPQSLALEQHARLSPVLSAPALFKTRNLIMSALILAVIWCGWWGFCAYSIKAEIQAQTKNNAHFSTQIEPVISGFPLRMKVSLGDTQLKFEDMRLHSGLVYISGWPLPWTLVSIDMPGQSKFYWVDKKGESKVVELGNTQLSFNPALEGLYLKSFQVEHGQTHLSAQGNVFVPFDFEEQAASGSLNLALNNGAAFIEFLQQLELIDSKAALVLHSILYSISLTQPDRIVRVPFLIENNQGYLSIFRVF